MFSRMSHEETSTKPVSPAVRTCRLGAPKSASSDHKTKPAPPQAAPGVYADEDPGGGLPLAGTPESGRRESGRRESGRRESGRRESGRRESGRRERGMRAP